MKAPGIYLAITLMAAVILEISSLQNLYAIDTVKNNPVVVPDQGHKARKVELEIDADRDKIIEESNAINADRRKLKDADKVSDKTGAEQIKKDIEERKVKIIDLKKEISDKKEQRYFLMNGKQKDEPRRNRQDAK